MQDIADSYPQNICLGLYFIGPGGTTYFAFISASTFGYDCIVAVGGGTFFDILWLREVFFEQEWVYFWISVGNL